MAGLVGSSGSGRRRCSTAWACSTGWTRGRCSWTAVVTALSPHGRRLFRRTVRVPVPELRAIDNATVAANLDVAFVSRGRPAGGPRAPAREARARGARRLRARGGLRNLSGGEQQRVAAGAAVQAATRRARRRTHGALDEGNADAIVGLLRELADEGRAVVVATHNPRVEQACDTVLGSAPDPARGPRARRRGRRRHAVAGGRRRRGCWSWSREKTRGMDNQEYDQFVDDYGWLSGARPWSYRYRGGGDLLHRLRPDHPEGRLLRAGSWASCRSSTSSCSSCSRSRAGRSCASADALRSGGVYPR